MTKRRRRRSDSSGSLSLSQVSLAISFLTFLSLYFIPETKSKMMTTQGVLIAGAGAFIMWVVLAALLYRLSARLSRRQAQSEPIQSAGPIRSINHLKPSNDPDTLLDIRRERLRDRAGLVERARTFEYEVASLLNTLTNCKAIVIGGPGDGGADVKVYKGHRLVGIVQCKRYQGTVPPEHVRALYAVKTRFGVKTAYLVTTGRFTAGTKKEAQNMGIQLIDGDKLKKMQEKAQIVIRANKARAI